jgi:hypothetical protein
MESKNLLVATETFSGNPHQQVEHRNVGPAGTQSEHARQKSDQDKHEQAQQGPVGFPFHAFSGAVIPVHALQSQGQSDSVLLGDHRFFGVLRKQQQKGDTHNGSAQAGLDQVGIQPRQIQAQHRAGNRARRGDQGYRQRQA